MKKVLFRNRYVFGLFVLLAFALAKWRRREVELGRQPSLKDLPDQRDVE